MRSIAYRLVDAIRYTFTYCVRAEPWIKNGVFCYDAFRTKINRIKPPTAIMNGRREDFRRCLWSAEVDYRINGKCPKYVLSSRDLCFVLNKRVYCIIINYRCDFAQSTQHNYCLPLSLNFSFQNAYLRTHAAFSF